MPNSESKISDAKIADPIAAAGPTSTRRSTSVTAPSITRRLTLLYAASTTALLLMAAGFLYWTLKRNLDHTTQGLLTSKIEVLRLLLRQPNKADVLVSEVEHEAAESFPLRYYVRILDEQGRTVVETPGLKDLGLDSEFPPPSAASVQPDTGIPATSIAGRSFLVLSAQALAGSSLREKFTIQIALDTSAGNALLVEYRRTILVVLAAGLVFAAVAGVWVARQGMQPLVEITKAARQINASQLHERIAGTRWPVELADLASAFDAMLDRLEDSFIRLSQFSADLAHELRTPINNLRGEAEVALARARSSDEYQQILASSLEEYERLSRMIDGLLFLARSDNPDAAVERIRFDVRHEIEAVREFYEALAGEQQVQVLCEGRARLMGDPALFRRAVSNLLANALKHTPAGGRVRIAMHTLDNQTVEVSVHDTGCGIAPEHLSKIFDRFYRVGSTRSKTSSGTGLGLAIVQSIMRLHGGSATAQSRAGEGTTITLKFPAPPADQAQAG